jgi:hypothetical protein
MPFTRSDDTRGRILLARPDRERGAAGEAGAVEAEAEEASAKLIVIP